MLNFTGTQGRPRAQYARDNFARETQLAMGQLAPKSIYVHVFVNGLYWGLHDLIERRDEEFVASHLGGSPTDYDVLQDDVFGDSGTVVSGDAVAWNAMMALANSGLSNNAQYQQIQQYLDIDAFIDYMNLHLYVGSQDWPNNNWTAYRQRTPDGRFFFTTWDAEYTLHDPTINRTGVSDSNSPGQIWAGLKNNAEFRLRFADRAHALLFNGGPLTPGPAAARYTALVNQIEDAMVDESARWGDYRRDVHAFLAPPYELSTRDNQWVTEKTRLLNTWFPARTNNVINQYKAANVYPNVVAPSFNQHGGPIVSGFQLTMTAPAGTIYYTLDGSDPRLAGGAVSPTALTYSTPITLTQNKTAKARVLSAGVWSALDEADFLIDLPQVRITELMYHPQDPPVGSPYTEDDFEYVEFQNVGPSPIDLQGMQLTDGVTFTFPSMVLNAGQYTVVVGNQTAFESRYGMGISIAGQYSGKLSDSGETVAFKDVFGQTIHSFIYSDAWQPVTDGSGYALVIADPLAAPATWANAASWQVGHAPDGSPGAAEPPALRVTELMYHPSDPPPGSIYGDEDFEYLELENVGATTIDLTGMHFTKGIDFTFPTGSLAPGQLALVVRNQAAFEQRYGAGKPIAGQYSGLLANQGDKIRLETAAGLGVFEFEYSPLWYPTTDGPGYSLVIVNAALHPATWDLASSWRVSTELQGSPGVSDPLFLAADVNFDGVIDIFDINLVSTHWDEAGPVGDGNHDGSVDIFDINLISASWGKLPGGGSGGGGGASTDVPTPAALSSDAAIAGDANGDGTVDDLDIAWVSLHFLQSAAVAPTADVNGDGTIDIFDVNFISSNWTGVTTEKRLRFDGAASRRRYGRSRQRRSAADSLAYRRESTCRRLRFRSSLRVERRRRGLEPTYAFTSGSLATQAGVVAPPPSRLVRRSGDRRITVAVRRPSHNGVGMAPDATWTVSYNRLSVPMPGADSMAELPDSLARQNLEYVEDLYAQFTADPASVAPDWRRYFERAMGGNGQAQAGRLGPSFRPASIFNPAPAWRMERPRRAISRWPACRIASTS